MTWQHPTKQILISICSVFPLVYVWMKDWGAWKLHLDNFDARKFRFCLVICLFGSIWNELHNLAVRLALQIAPRTRINWLRPASTICSSKTMLAVPIFHANIIQHHLLYFLCVFGGSNEVVAALGSKGKQLCSSKSSEEDGGSFRYFFYAFWSFLSC